ncbi:MAG: hypothetical protein FJZ61_03520 [Chlamydiae bacterium]|nr:hypothetical protein [Chlamydiota bacterium]
MTGDQARFLKVSKCSRALPVPRQTARNRLGALGLIEVDAWKPSLENFQYSNYVASKQKLQIEKYN